MEKKVYIIGIGGIGISAIARYYNENGYQVFGSDKVGSELIEKLKSEGINIIIGEDESRISSDFNIVVYTEAVPENQEELEKARSLGIETITYPESLARIANDKKLIAISGSHGKSTTTSLISIMLKNSSLDINTVVGTLLKEFDGKNAFFSNSEYFSIEACEYKRSFLRYKPYIGIITNIDLDHLDYYKDLADYESAFTDFIKNIKTGGYAILNGNCESSMKMLQVRNDINYVIVYNNSEIKLNNEIIKVPHINMQIPGDHILFDAHIAFAVGKILGLEENEIIKSLEAYTGVWRRSEIVGTTENGNILMSDYGHHPTEISLTLDALKERNPDKKLFVVFQPHQYSRTLELLDGFSHCFNSADTLVIPDIYESRDSAESIAAMNTEILLNHINHPNKINGNGLKNTLEIIKQYDIENPNSSIILLLGAGNVDDLRYDIETK
ncbi:MAG: UDP-N-acetylmuramate--L-alanine ligase [Candidatus Gracilibacteria bacterium]|nr:UDP-N-acetylmuramate--L-alanine ligase [Candidatus Gracilibacteria bacterium]